MKSRTLTRSFNQLSISVSKVTVSTTLAHTMGVGRGAGGGTAPWVLKCLAKKVVLSGKKQISPLLAPPEKILEKSA